jgi:hypothetical protein
MAGGVEVRTSPCIVAAAAIGAAGNFRTSLVAEKIPDATERETQLGIPTQPDFSHGEMETCAPDNAFCESLPVFAADGEAVR